MNKNGFIKIVEAVIAIMIILGVILISYGDKKQQKSLDLAEQARDILNEVANNNLLRANMLNAVAANPGAITVPQTIIDFINARVPSYLNFDVRACTVSSACGQLTYQGDVYSAERVISATNNIYDPANIVKLRLFLWEKS